MEDPGEGPGPPAPPIFRPNGDPMDRKTFLETAAPLSQGLDDRPPPTLSEGLDPPLLAVALGSSHSRKYCLTIYCYMTS